MNEKISINSQTVIIENGMFDNEVQVQYINCIKCSALIPYKNSDICQGCSSKERTNFGHINQTN